MTERAATLTHTDAPPAGYLLARPLGGFNDMLCQLERCARYAARFGRQLVVDTRGSGMLDDLLRYYAPRVGQEMRRPADLGWVVSELDGHVTVAGPDGAPLAQRDWQLERGFDLGQAHPDRVLVHATSGGGDLGVHFLERLHLREDVRAALLKRLATLPPGYTSLHIRNTDMQTEYQAAFRAAEGRFLGRPALVCSDDGRVVRYFQDTYGTRCDAVSTSDLSRTDGQTLHYDTSRDAWQMNIAMLTDLYALASGARICMVDTRGTKRSGFAVLAAHMLRRIRPLEAVDALEMASRGPNALRALAQGRLARVFRVREIGPGRYLCHPTYE